MLYAELMKNLPVFELLYLSRASANTFSTSASSGVSELGSALFSKANEFPTGAGKPSLAWLISVFYNFFCTKLASGSLIRDFS